MAESNPVSFATITIAMGAGIVVAIGDLVIRKARHLIGWGYGAVAAGAAVAFFSLFGLLFGIASVGVDGVLLVLSGVPMVSRERVVKPK